MKTNLKGDGKTPKIEILPNTINKIETNFCTKTLSFIFDFYLIILFKSKTYKNPRVCESVYIFLGEL